MVQEYNSLQLGSVDLMMYLGYGDSQHPLPLVVYSVCMRNFFFLFLGDDRDPISERKERQWTLPCSWLQVLISPLYLSCCFRHHLSKTGEEAGEHFVTPDSNLVWMPQERESWDSAFPLNKKLFLLNFSSLKPVLVFKREGADLPSRRTYTGSKDYLGGIGGRCRRGRKPRNWKI